MMYRILRNNKEQGPLHLNELLQLSLRPYDLIWVEGKSASWRYPHEVDTLQSYVESPVQTTETILSSSAPISTTVAITNSENIQALTNKEEEPELTADLLEQKANAIYQRIQAYNAHCEQQSKEAHTKYARTLEELKQDYANWLHDKKQKNKGLRLNSKGWMALGALGTAFIFFIIAGRNNEENSVMNTPTKLISLTSSEAKSVYHLLHKVDGNMKNVIDDTNLNKKSSVDAFIDSVRRVLKRGEIFKYPYPEEEKPINRKSLNVRKSDTPALIIHPLQTNTMFSEKPAIRTVAIDAGYLTYKNGRIKEINISVFNTGTVALDQVAINVHYYKKKNEHLHSETIYFSKIEPGSSYSVSKPGNKKAVTARFEVREL
jgi:hypothetical protein